MSRMQLHKFSPMKAQILGNLIGLIENIGLMEKAPDES
jgi:hypothetical protein